MGRRIHAAIAATAILGTIATSDARGSETVEPGKIGWTHLHSAAEEGSVAKIDALLFGGHNVDERITNGQEISRLKDIAEGRAKATIAEIERWGNSLSRAVEKRIQNLKQKHGDRSRSERDDDAESQTFAQERIIPKPEEIVEDILNDLNQAMKARIELWKVQIVEGATALHIAAVSGHYAAARRLIEKSADVNAETRAGMRPVDFAAMADQVQLLKLMIEHGADPEEPSTDEGLRPLHWAAWGNALQTARELLKRGVVVNATTSDGKTAVDMANLHGPEAYMLKEVLKQHGGQCARSCGPPSQ